MQRLGILMDRVGYLKLFRSLEDWEWYKDNNVKALFIHFLITVNYEDGKWEGKIIKRGQRVTSLQKLSEETGMSIQSIRTSIKKLKSTQELTYHSTSKYSLFTVVNYEKYQSATQSLTNKQQTNNKQLTNEQQQYKKNKKNKEEKEYTAHAPEDDTLKNRNF